MKNVPKRRKPIGHGLRPAHFRSRLPVECAPICVNSYYFKTKLACLVRLFNIVANTGDIRAKLRKNNFMAQLY